MNKEIILYCVRCRATHTGNKKDDFPKICPECKRETLWTKNNDSDDNKAYEWDNSNTNTKDINGDKTPLMEKYRKVLADPNLLDLILQEIGKKVVGEKETVKTIFIHGCGIWVKNHQIASYNLHLNDQPGLGKDFVMKATFDIFPKDNRVYRTKITPQVLAYWHKDDSTWTWDDKILYLEDISDEILKSDVFKIMASSGSHATVLIKQKPVDIKIRGKPVILITSYKTSPNDENLRRFPIVGCDETESQTLKIMQKQAQDAIRGEENLYSEEITGVLSLLIPKKVKVPYADKLPKFFPKNRFMRTHFHRFLDLIKASATLHQFQRERENEYIYANWDDYRIARDVLIKTTSNTEMVPLTKIQKGILNYFKIHGGRHSVSDIINKFPYTDKTLRFHLDKLFSYGLLRKDTESRSDSTRPVMVFDYNEENFNFNIPSIEAILPILPDSSTVKEQKSVEEEDKNNINIILNKNDKCGKSSIFDKIAPSLKELGFNDAQVVLISKIMGVMREHPHNEWFIGELGDSTGIPSDQIKDLLLELTSNPRNPTPIHMRDGGGDSYVFDGRELDIETFIGGGGNNIENKEVIK